VCVRVAGVVVNACCIEGSAPLRPTTTKQHYTTTTTTTHALRRQQQHTSSQLRHLHCTSSHRSFKQEIIMHILSSIMATLALGFWGEGDLQHSSSCSVQGLRRFTNRRRARRQEAGVASRRRRRQKEEQHTHEEGERSVQRTQTGHVGGLEGEVGRPSRSGIDSQRRATGKSLA